MDILKTPVMKYACIILLLNILSCQTSHPTKPIQLSELSVSDIHQAYEDGEYNSHQLVQAYLERIEKIDSITNAITLINPDALNIARELVEEYIGYNTGIIAPHTGQPAISVPMGFLEGNLPACIEFLGRMFAEPILIKFAYAFEQGTHHRVPPQ